MHIRTLGPSGPQVSAIGLGCMGMTDFYSTGQDRAEAAATLHRAVEQGITLFDTADMYGPFTNEDLLGEVLAPHRDQVFLATKFGILRDPARPQHRGVSGHPDYVRQSVEGSLRRLCTDRIDLYYQHRIDPAVPVEDTVGALADLVADGKIRFIGLSEAAPDTIRRAHAVHPVTAVQSEYSLWTRDPEETGVLATCAALGIGFVPYSPLGRGFLTGELKSPDDFAPDDYRRHSPRFQGENFLRNLHLVEALRQMAARRGVSASQLALAWVLAQGPHVVPIPGTKRRRWLDENVAAVALTLTAEERAGLEAAFPLRAAAGDRYPAESMGTVNR